MLSFPESFMDKFFSKDIFTNYSQTLKHAGY